MKQIPSILFAVLLFFAACSDPFLDEEDKSLVTSEEFFQEARDAQSAVDAIYSHLHGGSIYARYYWLIGALASDLAEGAGTDPDVFEFANFTLTPQNAIVARIWEELYAGIQTANFAIENIPRAPISEGEANELIAEARFFRAMFYFDLVRFFGGTPLVVAAYSDVKQDFLTPRAPVDSVYAQIVRDFEYSFEQLPASKGAGRPNRFAALAFLAKVYATQGEYSKAFQATRTIILSERYRLLPDYADVFKIANNNSAEIIFAINFSADVAAPMNLQTLPTSLNGRPLTLPSGGLISSFDPLDRRLAVSFLNDGGKTYVSKYWDENAEPAGGRTANDLPLIRYADVLLLHAEIVNELRNGASTEALFVINAVRRRARFDGQTNQAVLPDLRSMNYDDFKEAVLAERKRELAFEGHRWFDFKRFGRSPEQSLLPIPQREMDKNPNLSQNPGY